LGVVVPLDEAREPAPGLRPLIDLVSNDMSAVNRIILDKAVSDVELIPELAHHLIDSGGKRLRPMLTIAAAKLSGYQGGGHIRLAAAVEFMHTATLLHDDVVDESDYRRGKASARLVWGNQASVLVGDFLLGQAFRMMVDVGSL
jgi:octaprenyl-diphosphate synthase